MNGKGQSRSFGNSTLKPELTMNSHWPGYLTAGYFDDAGNLRADFVGEVRMHPLAKALIAETPALSMKQARQFFGQLRRVEALLRSVPDSAIPLFRADLAQLRTVANYRYDSGRNRKLSRLFKEFIILNVDHCESSAESRKATLQGFLPHFEALIAYLSLYRSE